MRRLENQFLAERICTFYTEKTGKDKIVTCHHFMKEGIHRQTITRILARFEARGTVAFKQAYLRSTTKSSIQKEDQGGQESYGKGAEHILLHRLLENKAEEEHLWVDKKGRTGYERVHTTSGPQVY